MVRLAKALCECGAGNDDVVFFDFCSLPQVDTIGKAGSPCPAYFDANGIFSRPLPSRTADETRAFRHAMWEMGRLYSYKAVEVIILPGLDGAGSFPGGQVWGGTNTCPYANRGWCCAEFAIAKKAKRIINLSDPEVQRVLHARQWPETIEEYAQMMAHTTRREYAGKNGLLYHETLGVDFTFRGDRDAVKYNFFKMTVNPATWQ